MQSCRRLWAFYTVQSVPGTHVCLNFFQTCGQGGSEEIICIQAFILMILVHVFDPYVRFDDLLKCIITPQTVFDILLNYFTKYF